MESKEIMTGTQNICISCGLCCDGTLIGFVQLEQEEIPTLKEIMEIEEEEGKGFFLQPCSNYCNGCTIYSQRPKKCAEFDCGLLESYQKNEINFNASNELIKEVKKRKLVIENKISILSFKLESKSFYFKMMEVKRYLDESTSKTSLNPELIPLASELENLNNLLSENFGVSFY